MRILERMIGRRAFLRQALYAAMALTGYGAGCMAGGIPGDGKTAHPADELGIRLPGTISWTEQGQREIIVSGKLPAGLVSGGVVLCAVEANRQTPYCVTLTGSRAAAVKKQVRGDGSVRFEVRADVVTALDLPELETMYFVHVSCGQYRSAVATLRIVKGT